MARALLIAGAHPDDETFFVGTMAKYAREGVRVGIVCGTRGERGATADLCSVEELPRVREAELRNAMRVTGLEATDVHFLPYEDQKLSQAPLDDVRRHLVRVIRAIRAQVVVCFDPNGANRHPDHVAMSRFVADATAAAADYRWYPETGPNFSVTRLLWQPPLPAWQLPVNAALSEYPGVDFLIDTKSCADVKEAAIREYRTQLPGLKRLFFENGRREMTLHREAFRLAWGPHPQETPSKDLFEGL